MIILFSRSKFLSTTGDCVTESLLLKGVLGKVIKHLWLIEPEAALSDVGTEGIRHVAPSVKVCNQHFK